MTTEPAAERMILTPESEPAETAPRAARGSHLHPAEIEAAFVAFWEIYPLKKKKEAARRKYVAALRRGISPAIILLGCRRYAGESAAKVAKGMEPKFIAHPATWLHGGGWDDEPEPASKSQTGGFMSLLKDAAMAGGADFFGLRDEGDDAPAHAGATLDLEAEPATDGGRAA